MIFATRTVAGWTGADRLVHLHGDNRVVLGLPRAGVVVAFEVAAEIAAPLDASDARKVAVPAQPELGAVGRWYADCSQTRDTEVVAPLQRSRAGTGTLGIHARARRFRSFAALD
jgi:predicted phosphoribosyltransferase